MTLDATIRAVQAKLGVAVDGNPGPQTWTAIHRGIVGEPPATTGTSALADERSERNIATLLPEVQPLARALIESAACHRHRDQGDLRHSHLRGAERALRAGPHETGPHRDQRARRLFESQLRHRIRHRVFEGGRYIAESPAYKAVGAIGMKLGLEWGGNWKSIQDEPHFQLRPAWARRRASATCLPNCAPP